MGQSSLLAFAHIPKTGGTTINRLLWRTYGIGHVGADFRNPPPVYTLRDLEFDLTLYPFARSIAGHGLKPFVDYGDVGRRMVWFTMLRDPVRRYLSHYQHQYVKGPAKFQLPFPKWMRTFDRDNVMVRFIAGSDDIEAAKEILRERFHCVGIMERFDESLTLMRSNLPAPELRVQYSRPSNVSSSDVKKRIEDNIDRFREEIEYRNMLDLELYRYAIDVLWPRQVAVHGAQPRSGPGSATPVLDRGRELSYLLYRRCLYKPVVWVDRHRQRRHRDGAGAK
ncbi:MAG: sulfotransferase family 2 domain-containing protein [Rhodothermia bacterium]|nr:sulfotransferase family 2 domain-containing protein [Rhodothermia bacterium]